MRLPLFFLIKYHPDMKFKSFFTLLALSAVALFSFSSCGDDEPSADLNTWVVVKNGVTKTYSIKSAAIFYNEGVGCSLVFFDKPYNVVGMITKEPECNWCAIDIPLGKPTWDFCLATNDCRPLGAYYAEELSKKKQSFNGPSAEGVYNLKFSCRIPKDDIDIAINYKGIPQDVFIYFWEWDH